MGRIQTIENALKEINDTIFQELCDSYLKLRNQNYRAFSRTGSVTGKQKTKAGTPDSFFLLSNGNYMYIEVTTNVTNKNKLNDDIEGCFDAKKTKISIDKIEEVVLCFNWNIDQEEIEKLQATAGKFNPATKVTYLMLDDLAMELHMNHRDLARLYLGVSMDTGQVVSIDQFIQEYNRASQGISTPLNNTFLHREQALEELKEALSQSDFVILHGAAGVGKTKLALEGIASFLSENLSFDAYCVSYKNVVLLDDLYTYLDKEKDYVLFVDDANRIDAFGQILGFYKTQRKGKLKILMTIRDYALNDFDLLCQEYGPRKVSIEKLTDEQIIDIIKAEPFEVINPAYHRVIERIANGNPRLAIMTALLAKEHQNIYVLQDVSDLFEKYFSTFVKDEGEFASQLNIKCLGLIAFFYTIPYKNRTITTAILENFGIEYSEFIESIDKLENLELLEIQYDHVKIPEQNLSTFFFYKAFVKDDLLSFDTLLKNYFESTTARFRECVIPANNTFSPSRVMNKLQPSLRLYWGEIKSDEEKAFKFLNTFWFYMGSESLEFIYIIIESMPTDETAYFEFDAVVSDNLYDKNQVIELIGLYIQFPDDLKDFIELGFEYVRRSPELLAEWIEKINKTLSFDIDDQNTFRFTRQIVLFDLLIDGLHSNDPLLREAFYSLSMNFLAFKFHQTKSGRKNSITWYDYPLPDIPVIHEFRKKIWNALDQQYHKNPELSFNVLLSYSKDRNKIIKEILEFDISLLVDIITKHLKKDDFLHCKYVQDQIRWWKRSSVLHSFEELKKGFTNPTYETFLKIDWDRLRDKEIYDFKDYKEYDKLKEADIRNSFVFKDIEEAKEFYEVFVYLKKSVPIGWNYIRSFEFIIDENLLSDFDIGCFLLEEIIADRNGIEYQPRIVFNRHLKTKKNAERIWQMIEKYEFRNKNFWKLDFFSFIDTKLLNKEHVDRLLETISNLEDRAVIYFDWLHKFLSIEPDIFQIILKIVVQKNEGGKQFQLWMDTFDSQFTFLGDDIELIKRAYLQQETLHQVFDYEGKGLLNILRRDQGFLLKFVTKLFEVKISTTSTFDSKLHRIWKIDNIEDQLKAVFDLSVERGCYYGMLEHFCNSFFWNLEDDDKARAKEFLLEYCDQNFEDSDKMDVVVDIARHSMKELYDELLLRFLTLIQDVRVFSKISWRGNSTSGSGGVILADIEMADWMNIRSIVERSELGIKLIPIKKYLKDRIEGCKRSGDRERERQFLEPF